MNRHIYNGISSKGYLGRFAIDKIEAGKDGLFVQGLVEGKLCLEVDAAKLLAAFVK
jgi:hypothetical protein